MSKTIRVRIAVAVSATGRWGADGSNSDKDGQSEATALELIDFEHPNRVTFVEADVPLPEEQATVEGEVAP